MISGVDIGLLILLEMPFLSSHDVLAYLDPGTGSFLVQLLIGGIVGALVLLKAYWAKIRAFFSKGNQNQSVDSQEPEQLNTDSDNE